METNIEFGSFGEEKKRMLNPEELKVLEELKKEALEIASFLGELNYQKISIDLQIELQTNRIREIKKNEAVFFDKIKDVYGNVTINIDTGEIS